jgi:hypothetical protein
VTEPGSSPDPRLAVLLIAVAFVVVVAIAFGLGRCSAPEPVDPVLVGDVDAGPGDRAIAERLDGAVRAEDDRIAALEREHAEEVEAFEAADRAAYEAERARGRDALARWFKDRTQQLLKDGGP